MIERLLVRISELEALVRAKNRKIEAMYNSDLEAGWPREADDLQYAYEQRYGVDLEEGE